jgi:thymidylate kinase
MIINIYLQIFFQKLRVKNINYCVLRNYEQLPDSLGGSDLDILVHQKDLKIFYSLLDESLKQSHGKIIVQYGKLVPRICIVGGESNSWYGIQLDVHEGILPYKTANMFPVEFLLSRVNIHNNILVANDDDADLIAFLKEVLNNEKCKEKYFEDAKKTWTKNRLLYTDVLLSIYDEKFIKLMAMTLEDNYNQINVLKLAKYGQHLLSQGISIKVKNLRSKVSRFYRFFNPPGFSIAVLGTDGAGKTTIIDAIKEPLNEAVHKALFYEHMRPNLIPNIAQLFGKKQQVGSVVNPHAAKASGLAGSLLRLLYYSFDYILGYWLKVYPVMVKKSSIWIFDRYYYDYLVDPKRARINLPIWMIKRMMFFIPEPDLILCLGAEPKVIHDRKPELPLDEVIEQVSKLKYFCESEKKAIWIDTGKSLDVAVKQTLETIVNKMASRYN